LRYAADSEILTRITRRFIEPPLFTDIDDDADATSSAFVTPPLMSMD